MLETKCYEKCVLDARVHGAVVAVLTEDQAIDLIELHRYQVVRTIREVVNAKFAIGSEWIIFSSSTPSYWYENSGDSSINAQYEKRFRHQAARSDALIGNKIKYGNSQSTSPSFTAVDVAQSLASGIYYLGELGRSTLSPYFSSPPELFQSRSRPNVDTGDDDNYVSGSLSASPNQKNVPNNHSGSVIVQSLQSERILCRFKCHSSPIAGLSIDRSGLLIATCSIKGQNIHVYRLFPALQSKCAINDDMAQSYQLLYKLQRGITHAQIIDIAFSQDSKWITATSARGTSHVYAIHPEGGRITQYSHLDFDTDLEDGEVFDELNGMQRKHIDDFCADYRILETKKLSQVARFHHSLPVSMKSGGYGRKDRSVFESALDVSHTFINQRGMTPSSSFHNCMIDSEEGRQYHSPTGIAHSPPISCCFGHDNLVLFCCNFGNVLVLQLKCNPVNGRKTSLEARMEDAQFMFDVTFDVVNRWNMQQVSTFQKNFPHALSTKPYIAESKCDGKSELRTYVDREVPLWARPSIKFRVTDSANPEGRIQEVNRRGPNVTRGGSQTDRVDAAKNWEANVFVFEMDSYFGTGKSPVFDGQDCNQLPEIPGFNLYDNIDTAMRSSVKLSKEDDTLKKAEPEDSQTIKEIQLTDRPGMCSGAEPQSKQNGFIAGVVLQESYFNLPEDQT